MASNSIYNFTSLVPKPNLYKSSDFNGWSNATEIASGRNSKLLGQYNTAYNKALLAQNLAAEIENKYNEAKGANEKRYNQILTGFGGLTGDVNKTFAGLTKQQEQDVVQSTQNAKASNAQALVNSGMVGTTILPSLNMQADKNAASQLNRIHDTIAMAKLGYLNDLGKSKLAFMERRDDTYPNASFYSDLIKQFGNFSDVQYTYS